MIVRLSSIRTGLLKPNERMLAVSLTSCPSECFRALRLLNFKSATARRLKFKSEKTWVQAAETTLRAGRGLQGYVSGVEPTWVGMSNLLTVRMVKRMPAGQSFRARKSSKRQDKLTRALGQYNSL